MNLEIIYLGRAQSFPNYKQVLTPDTDFCVCQLSITFDKNTVFT